MLLPSRLSLFCAVGALLHVEFDYLNCVARHGVVEVAGDLVQGGLDGDDAGGIVDGVGGLRVVRSQANQLC